MEYYPPETVTTMAGPVSEYRIVAFERQADGTLGETGSISEPFEDPGAATMDDYNVYAPPAVLSPACVAISRNAQFVYAYLPERMVSSGDVMGTTSLVTIWLISRTAGA